MRLLKIILLTIPFIYSVAMAQSLDFAGHDNYSSFYQAYQSEMAAHPNKEVSLPAGLQDLPSDEQTMVAAMLQAVTQSESRVSQIIEPSRNCPGKNATASNPAFEVDYVQYFQFRKFYVKASHWWMEGPDCMRKVADGSVTLN